MHARFVSRELERLSTARHDAPPRHTGTRFNAEGEFLPEPGNTIVCHLVQGSASQSAVVATRQRFLDMPEAGNLAFTPVSSFHMTVFQGIIEYRRMWPYWPKEMPLTASIDAMTEYYLERLSVFSALPDFAMQISGLRPTGLVLKGKTAEDDRALALWRNTFAKAFGYRHPDHDKYEFHLTLAYVVRWFDPVCLPRWQAMMDEEVEKLRDSVPVIELQPPAFCEFRDMNHFKELIVFDKA